MFPRSLALLVLIVALATGCTEPREAFLCTDSSQCRDGTGTCESTGFCSFGDTTCSSGRRYGEHAGDTLSETCVINPMGDFDVVSAASTSNTSMTVTFSAPPDPAAAVIVANYSVDGLTLTGTPSLAGNTVSFTTAVQSNVNYTVTASGIARASDAAPLWVTSATFPGRASFDVIGAVSATNGIVRVMFNGAPDPATGTNVANYDIPGLTLIGTPTISGNIVTLFTSPQSAISYTVTATGVTRASDGEALTLDSATLTGRTAFNVVSAVSLNSTAISVTFDAPPEIVQATTLANYSIPGLTLSGTPIFMGSSVMISTSPQGSQTYTVTVSGVTREVDAEPLLVAAANFSGISTFNVASAAATTSVRITVTFDQAPNAGQATTLGNYSVPGLTLSGTPTLSGNTVTIVTAAQAATMYTVTVSNVTRASDGEPLTVAAAMFPGRAPFNVASASSLTTSTIKVTFDAAPNATQAAVLANYSVPGLTLSGTPVLSGNEVTITTSQQSAVGYTITVLNVTRDSDAEALTVNNAAFSGRSAFNVTSTVALNNTTIRVTFSAAPNAAQATTLANYSVPGLTLSAPVLSGSQVTLTTSQQSAMGYTMTVSNVTRSSDAEALFVNTASFTGIPIFNVTSAASTTNTQMTVTFNGAPNAAQAATLANYSVPGLTLSGTPTLSGNTVTITTSGQSAIAYTVTVQNVTRASDAEPLTIASVMFTGRASFNVSSATSLSTTSVRVTFSAAPTMAQATTLANYAIAGLSLSGTPVLSGSQVTLTTSTQLSQSYTVVVSNVTRESDAEALTVNSAPFSGRPTFSVASVVPLTNTSVRVTFDAAPNAAQATTLANYSVPGLSLSAPILVGSAVTFTTTPQLAQSYTMTVSNVTRASDAEPLFVNNGSFTGIPVFNVASAASQTSTRITVTFNSAPNPTEATTVGNYSVSGLTLSAPSLSGNTVTLTTSAQAAQGYTITVSGVTRASDGEALTITSAMFTGRAPFNVTNVASLSNRSVGVTFGAAPNSSQATTLANYAIPGLTLSGTPSLSGNTVTIATSAQSAISYTATVSNVTRSSDAEALTTNSGGFTGRVAFNVNSAVSLSSTSMRVTFSHAPTASQATTLANYSVPGLTLSAPSLSGTSVTFTTSVQSAISYTVTVSNVTRATDSEELGINNRSFTGRAPFNVTGATSATNVSMTVTFSAPPNVAQATALGNYSVPGLTLSGTPVLSGSTVTITTSSQSVQSYTVTVSNVTRASDAEAMTTNNAMFTGKTGFNVSSAASVNSTTMSVTFDAAPNAAQATTLGNYSVPGLTLSGTPMLSGNTVTITTSAQASQTYTVTVTNVLRNSDNVPLAANTANFTHVTFNVTSAASVSSGSVSVTFDAPPNVAAATTLGNYSIPGLTLNGTPSLSGNTVTLSTSAQSAVSYTVNVSNVTRASDGAILTVANASFTGREPFNVASAMSTSSGTMTVTFSHAPNSAQATTLTNYNVPGLTLGGTPLLSGNVVTLTTTAQNGGSYTVTVSNVARASDSEALSTDNASFSGTALQTPTVTNVAITATSPNNGTAKYYNTGTVTVVITGTDFTGVSCPSGVGLDDRNGANTLISTRATSCTFNSGTQITATFPAGIRTNGATGWNVQVTNAAGTNSTSTVPLVPHAGLLVSEVMIGGATAQNADKEFIELYNPTNLAINVSTLGLSLHIRNAGGTDTALPLTYVRTVVPSHGYLLLASTGSHVNDPWNTAKDASYNSGTAQLVPSGGVYISLSATAQTQVLDKLGWGTQPTGGFEGTVFGLLNPDNSTQRMPGGAGGAGTDTDVNSTDFNPQSTTFSIMNSLSPPQP